MTNTITPQHAAQALERPTGRTRRRPDALMQCGFTTKCAGTGTVSVLDARRVGHMRTIVTAQLRDLGLGPLVEVMQQIVSELVTNAIEHASGPVTLSLLITGTKARLEVQDSGAGYPRQRSAGSEEENGRGLLLVDSLTTELGGRWGFDPDRRTVWVEIPTPTSTP